MANPVRLDSLTGVLPRMAASDLTSDFDLTAGELVALLDLADDVKRNPGRYTRALPGRYLSLLFEKPSLRTRLTFELAIKQLGGDSITVTGPIGGREPLSDVARNLDRWTQGIVARTFSQTTIDELAHWSSVPVINALSDTYHPCQALADFQTLRERWGDVRGHKLAFIGDGNNVAHSLLLNAAKLGMDFALGTPAGYGANPDLIEKAREIAAESGSRLQFTQDPDEAASGASAIYTDVWASMGQESETERRRAHFAPYQVNEALFGRARPEALFLHCLPAKRGEEVAAGVIDSPRSMVYDQAENRLHAQKALLLMLL